MPLGKGRSALRIKVPLLRKVLAFGCFIGDTPLRFAMEQVRFNEVGHGPDNRENHVELAVEHIFADAEFVGLRRQCGQDD